MAEYNAHRQEILATTAAQHSTLALGIAAIGVLAAGAFNVWEDDPFVATVVFLGAVPLLTTTILVIWMSQILGMLDIGHYLLQLEASIANVVDQPNTGLLTWEKRISRQSALAWPPNYAWHYLAVVGLFGLLTISAIVLGAYRADTLETTIAAFAIGTVFVAMCVAIALAVVRARDRNLKEADRHPWVQATSGS